MSTPVVYPLDAPRRFPERPFEGKWSFRTSTSSGST